MTQYILQWLAMHCNVYAEFQLSIRDATAHQLSYTGNSPRVVTQTYTGEGTVLTKGRRQIRRPIVRRDIQSTATRRQRWMESIPPRV